MSRNSHELKIVLIVMAAVSLSIPRSAPAEERQFLVILAHSPKQFGGGFPPGGLTNPQLIDRQYFDNIADNDIYSFLEYWEEISYGDVRISESFQLGKTTEWIILPWSIEKQGGTEGFIDLNESTEYEFGAGERFRNDRAMSIVDLDGDPGTPAIDNGPFTSFSNPPFARGGNDTLGGVLFADPVWMPGERFVDMDGDGRWDALDEARNQMDFFAPCSLSPSAFCAALPGSPTCDLARGLCVDGTGAAVPDQIPDLRGPWIDLDGDGAAANADSCVYLADSDNDLKPDCCPHGPGKPGCDPFDSAAANEACPATTWTDANGDSITDCNGNLIDDAEDIRTGTSNDRLPLQDSGIACDLPTPDGIPDECQFQVLPGAPGLLIVCVETLATDPSSGCTGVTDECVELVPTRMDDLLPRCEFDDSNGNGVLDIVEPFENFLRRWDTTRGEWVAVNAAYITANYPGDPAKVINRSIAPGNIRVLTGPHDPGGLLTTCVCSDGAPCVAGQCDAGEHAEFNPPDFWTEVDTTKMYNIDPGDQFDGGEFLVETTARPSWFAQAWSDRYGSPPPPWNSFGGTVDAALTPLSVPIQASRRCFRADQGGVNGDGSGWVGCGGSDPFIVFESSIDCTPGDAISTAFDQACPPVLILPEETNGVDNPLVLFDGPREFDDLPSSKYHRGGDERLGEVTSPFNEDIWGEDRGRDGTGFGLPDKVLPAAGPYATMIHGNFGRDAGNLLLMELLTLRTDGLSVTGLKDTNLDGMVDQGELRNPGSENYITQPDGEGDGTTSDYPWNRQRLVEDCIEILDSVIDFEDFVDRASLDQVECVSGPISKSIPLELQGGGGAGVVVPDGVLSGIVLLPTGAPTFPRSPSFYAIHNEDIIEGVGPQPDTSLPRIQSTPPAFGLPIFKPRISWSLFFHDLVTSLDADSQSDTLPTGGFQTAFAANAYLNAWEGFPDLFDYDRFDNGAIENCPIGAWDIMASGGLVHPIPTLKERACTDWTDPVDLTSVLTPGVDRTLLLPPAEFVRDESYYFIENEARPGERYYFWSAGHPDSADARMPGAGMLVLHTDVGSNLDAVPQQQRSGTRPAFLIVQADGDNDLQACSTGGNTGDAADPWPGSTNATRFNFDTVPSATWYTQNSWTGIDILDVVPDGNGSVQITINWVPTSIPSLRFVDPPGGQSVGDLFQVRFDATDVFGGTEIRIFYTLDEKKKCGGTGAACTLDSDCTNAVCEHDLTMSPGNFVGSLLKVTPGTNHKSMNWDLTPTGLPNVPDGRYVLFAKLNPGVGADGTEAKNTKSRAGRNNVGNGTIAVTSVNIDDDTTDTDDSARLETWAVTCIDPDLNGAPPVAKFLVTSSLSQSDSLVAASTGCADPLIACTGASYTAPGSKVVLTLTAGATPFELDDSFTFTTTGITAPSQPFSITDGEISAGPIARIVAAPLSGLPPLEVEFDATSSVEPNGDPLDFEWDFGDDSDPVQGSVVTHEYVAAGTFTVTLRATNSLSGVFGEVSVDVTAVNNSPRAALTASPTSGLPPLSVQFSGANSSDTETPSAELIYQWDFGDGRTGNDQGIPGVQIETTHAYSTTADGMPCTETNRCTFFASLTVTDALGKSDSSETTKILVGNSNPVARVTASPLSGPAPLTVNFNAFASTDADDDADDLDVVWHWDDGSAPEPRPLKGNVADSEGNLTGLVRHTYTTPKTDTDGNVIPFRPTAEIKDNRDGLVVWPGVEITVTANQEPTAKCTVTPAVGVVGVTLFRFNASTSTDPDAEALTYSWDFKDGTSVGHDVLETHEFQTVRTFDVELTVADQTENDTVTCPVTVNAVPDNLPPLALIATGLRICAATCALEFDGSLSIDPEETDLTYDWAFSLDDNPCQSSPCPTGFTCESDVCVARTTGETITIQFRTPGDYSVVLTVTDEGGAFDSVGPQLIRVLEPGASIVPDPPSDRPLTGGGLDDAPPQSSLQRPRGLCGFGVVTSFVGSLFGLGAMSIARRRSRRRSASVGG